MPRPVDEQDDAIRPEFTVSLKIRRRPSEVFDAVVDDRKLAGYFIDRASGPMVAGQTVQWKFPEFPDFYPVEVMELTAPGDGEGRIVLAWGAADGGDAPYNTRVEMVFKPLNDSDTMVSITESGWRRTPAGFKAAFGNAPGWMHMMCGLKASLEYGINLREGGAF